MMMRDWIRLLNLVGMMKADDDITAAAVKSAVYCLLRSTVSAI